MSYRCTLPVFTRLVIRLCPVRRGFVPSGGEFYEGLRSKHRGERDFSLDSRVCFALNAAERLLCRLFLRLRPVYRRDRGAGQDPYVKIQDALVHLSRLDQFKWPVEMERKPLDLGCFTRLKYIVL